MLNQYRGMKQATAFITLVAFGFTQLGVSSPASAAPFQVTPVEVSVPKFLDFHIPEELGRIETMHLSNQSETPFIVHIQTAHGQYAAEKSIEKILTYLKKEYGFDTVLLEGDFGRLNPEILNFVPQDSDRTHEIQDFLAQKTLVKGVEMYLGQNRDAQGLGIEDSEAYLSNAHAFSEVLMQRSQSEEFAKQVNEGIARFSSQHLNKGLLGFTRHQDSFADGVMSFEGWLNFLSKKSQQYLDLDFSHAHHQIEWPMLVRMHQLDVLSSDFESRLFEKQKLLFLKQLYEYTKNSDVVREVDSMLNNPVGGNSLNAGQLHDFIENLIGVLPSDYDYKTIDQVTNYLAQLVFHAEIDPVRLFGEISQLETLILDHLSTTQIEDQIVRLLERFRVVKKLFKLELTPEEYEMIVSDPTSFSPLTLRKEFEVMAKLTNSKQVNFSKLEELTSLYQKALEFYAWAKERDEIMIENVEKRIAEEGLDRAVVITGGFHSSPFTKHFRQSDSSYVLISPFMEEISEQGLESYKKMMVYRFGVLERKSTLELAATMGIDLKTDKGRAWFDAVKLRMLDEVRGTEFDEDITAWAEREATDVPRTDVKPLTSNFSEKPTVSTRSELRMTSGVGDLMNQRAVQKFPNRVVDKMLENMPIRLEKISELVSAKKIKKELVKVMVDLMKMQKPEALKQLEEIAAELGWDLDTTEGALRVLGGVQARFETFQQEMLREDVDVSEIAQAMRSKGLLVRELSKNLSHKDLESGKLSTTPEQDLISTPDQKDMINVKYPQKSIEKSSFHSEGVNATADAVIVIDKTSVLTVRNAQSHNVGRAQAANVGPLGGYIEPFEFMFSTDDIEETLDEFMERLVEISQSENFLSRLEHNPLAGIQMNSDLVELRNVLEKRLHIILGYEDLTDAQRVQKAASLLAAIREALEESGYLVTADVVRRAQFVYQGPDERHPSNSKSSWAEGNVWVFDVNSLDDLIAVSPYNPETEATHAMGGDDATGEENLVRRIYTFEELDEINEEGNVQGHHLKYYWLARGMAREVPILDEDGDTVLALNPVAQEKLVRIALQHQEAWLKLLEGGSIHLIEQDEKIRFEHMNKTGGGFRVFTVPGTTQRFVIEEAGYSASKGNMLASQEADQNIADFLRDIAESDTEEGPSYLALDPKVMLEKSHPDTSEGSEWLVLMDQWIYGLSSKKQKQFKQGFMAAYVDAVNAFVKRKRLSVDPTFTAYLKAEGFFKAPEFIEFVRSVALVLPQGERTLVSYPVTYNTQSRSEEKIHQESFEEQQKEQEKVFHFIEGLTGALSDLYMTSRGRVIGHQFTVDKIAKKKFFRNRSIAIADFIVQKAARKAGKWLMENQIAVWLTLLLLIVLGNPVAAAGLIQNIGFLQPVHGLLLMLGDMFGGFTGWGVRFVSLGALSGFVVLAYGIWPIVMKAGWMNIAENVARKELYISMTGITVKQVKGWNKVFQTNFQEVEKVLEKRRQNLSATKSEKRGIKKRDKRVMKQLQSLIREITSGDQYVDLSKRYALVAKRILENEGSEMNFRMETWALMILSDLEEDLRKDSDPRNAVIIEHMKEWRESENDTVQVGGKKIKTADALLYDQALIAQNFNLIKDLRSRRDDEGHQIHMSDETIERLLQDPYKSEAQYVRNLRMGQNGGEIETQAIRLGLTVSQMKQRIFVAHTARRLGLILFENSEFQQTNNGESEEIIDLNLAYESLASRTAAILMIDNDYSELLTTVNFPSESEKAWLQEKRPQTVLEQIQEKLNEIQVGDQTYPINQLTENVLEEVIPMVVAKLNNDVDAIANAASRPHPFRDAVVNVFKENPGLFFEFAAQAHEAYNEGQDHRADAEITLDPEMAHLYWDTLEVDSRLFDKNFLTETGLTNPSLADELVSYLDISMPQSDSAVFVQRVQKGIYSPAKKGKIKLNLHHLRAVRDYMKGDISLAAMRAEVFEFYRKALLLSREELDIKILDKDDGKDVIALVGDALGEQDSEAVSSLIENVEKELAIVEKVHFQMQLENFDPNHLERLIQSEEWGILVNNMSVPASYIRKSIGKLKLEDGRSAARVFRDQFVGLQAEQASWSLFFVQPLALQIQDEELIGKLKESVLQQMPQDWVENYHRNLEYILPQNRLAAELSFWFAIATHGGFSVNTHSWGKEYSPTAYLGFKDWVIADNGKYPALDVAAVTPILYYMGLSQDYAPLMEKFSPENERSEINRFIRDSMRLGFIFDAPIATDSSQVVTVDEPAEGVSTGHTETSVPVASVVDSPKTTGKAFTDDEVALIVGVLNHPTLVPELVNALETQDSEYAVPLAWVRVLEMVYGVSHLYQYSVGQSLLHFDVQGESAVGMEVIQEDARNFASLIKRLLESDDVDFPMLSSVKENLGALVKIAPVLVVMADREDLIERGLDILYERVEEPQDFALVEQPEKLPLNTGIDTPQQQYGFQLTYKLAIELALGKSARAKKLRELSGNEGKGSRIYFLKRRKSHTVIRLQVREDEPGDAWAILREVTEVHGVQLISLDQPEVNPPVLPPSRDELRSEEAGIAHGQDVSKLDDISKALELDVIKGFYQISKRDMPGIYSLAEQMLDLIEGKKESDDGVFHYNAFNRHAFTVEVERWVNNAHSNYFRGAVDDYDRSIKIWERMLKLFEGVQEELKSLIGADKDKANTFLGFASRGEQVVRKKLEEMKRGQKGGDVILLNIPKSSNIDVNNPATQLILFLAVGNDNVKAQEVFDAMNTLFKSQEGVVAFAMVLNQVLSIELQDRTEGDELIKLQRALNLILGTENVDEMSGALAEEVVDGVQLEDAHRVVVKLDAVPVDLTESADLQQLVEIAGKLADINLAFVLPKATDDSVAKAFQKMVESEVLKLRTQNLAVKKAKVFVVVDDDDGNEAVQALYEMNQTYLTLGGQEEDSEEWLGQHDSDASGVIKYLVNGSMVDSSQRAMLVAATINAALRNEIMAGKIQSGDAILKLAATLSMAMRAELRLQTSA